MRNKLYLIYLFSASVIAFYFVSKPFCSPRNSINTSVAVHTISIRNEHIEESTTFNSSYLRKNSTPILVAPNLGKPIQKLSQNEGINALQNLKAKLTLLNNKDYFNGEKVKRVYKSCAVVGSSPIILGKLYGAEIDFHEAVFRGNIAPTRGYELDVGKRTTIRVCCCPWMGPLNHKCNNMPGESLDYVVSKLRYYSKSQYMKEHKIFMKLKKKFPRMLAPSYTYFSDLNKRIYETNAPQELATGALLFAIALEFCSGNISVYGYDTVKTHAIRRNGGLKDLRYNYYEYNKVPAAGYKKTPHRFGKDSAFICNHPRSKCATNVSYSYLAYEKSKVRV